MSLTSQENLYRLLWSGELESVKAGLEVAQNQRIDIASFIEEIEYLYHYVEAGSSKAIADKITEIYSISELYLANDALEQLQSCLASWHI